MERRKVRKKRLDRRERGKGRNNAIYTMTHKGYLWCFGPRKRNKRPLVITCLSYSSLLCIQWGQHYVAKEKFHGYTASDHHLLPLRKCLTNPYVQPIVKTDNQTPFQLASISPTPTMPAKPSRMDSVDPIRSAITSMGDGVNLVSRAELDQGLCWCLVSPPPPVKHVSTAIP